ncbi:hypothetical protein BDY21DRAFT_371193 [Lineolata rhizophorae]|uniref:Uncharacterized protein n=1 Tax=Lineolata rhizophorae TaxID=578093 RepID=A0A6A6P3M9_9PEZI|nr:hypothetical protein BDY21DRAFT_371193 [Lineolata rhizophorae]
MVFVIPDPLAENNTSDRRYLLPASQNDANPPQTPREDQEETGEIQHFMITGNLDALLTVNGQGEFALSGFFHLVTEDFRHDAKPDLHSQESSDESEDGFSDQEDSQDAFSDEEGEEESEDSGESPAYDYDGYVVLDEEDADSD